jgi:L-lactate dehydrogenase complex protein LldG
MNSRERILTAVKNNQPAFVGLPVKGAGLKETNTMEIPAGENPDADVDARANEFAAILESIGGVPFMVSGFDEIAALVKKRFPDAKRILSNCPELPDTDPHPLTDPHTLADTDLAILRAEFGVAENGAVWLTEGSMIERVLPFICQHLAVVIDKEQIVPTLHEAYTRIAGDGYGFGVFIAGPSKTADIEQSLVLGAHGPVSMTVFIMG